MKKLTWIFALTLALSLTAACGDDGNNETPDAAAQNPDAPTPPANVMPALAGTQIDRSGRPAISTALQASFVGDDAMRGMAKDDYNADADPANWASYAGDAVMNAPGTGFVLSLAVLDSLDDNCGNQLAYEAGGAGTHYSALAGLLANDVLLVDSANGTCGQYLGVEAAQVLGLPVDDCGGRTPLYDIVDISYSALAIGMLAGVGDGIAMDDAAHNADNFPFLAAPL